MVLLGSKMFWLLARRRECGPGQWTMACVRRSGTRPIWENPFYFHVRAQARISVSRGRLESGANAVEQASRP